MNKLCLSLFWQACVSAQGRSYLDAYDEIKSGNSLNVGICVKDSLDNWRISLMTDGYYLY